MPSPFSDSSPLTVVLATGGTIAGAAAEATDNVRYRAAQVGVQQLIAAVPALAAHRLQAEQVAQLDSRDMNETVWRALVERCSAHLARSEVSGVVVTHGTDTLEETAWLLQRVLAPRKPVVLTAAMRPATSMAADGPQNLLDAVRVAEHRGARGVLVSIAGEVFAAADVQKVHSYRSNAFAALDAGVVARVEEGALRVLREWPAGERPQADAMRRPPPEGVSQLGSGPSLTREAVAWPAGVWPWVEIITSHALARPATVRALVEAGVQGLVIAGTGNGTVHEAWLPALADAQRRGVAIALASRCAAGPVLAARPDGWRVYPGLNAVKTRIELALDLLRPPSA